MREGDVHTASRSNGETWLGDYQLISRIGSGGMGTVYLAHHAPTGQHVALKVLSSRATADIEFAVRFQREANAVASLDHPNIVRVFDASCIEGRCFIAMAYLNYGTLKDRIATIRAGGEHMPIAEALEVTRQIAMALDYAHKRNLIHRDVKPANIMLAAGGRYVLTDFGTVLVQTATRLTTQTGRLIGTVEYLSPEQANQQPFDHRVDVYALGVVLYEMLAGCAPFSGENDMLVVYAHAHREPRPIGEQRAGVPRSVVRIVAKAMHKQPAQRYVTAGEMALDIDRVLSELESASASRAVALKFTPRQVVMVVVCFVVLAVVLMAGAFTTSAHTRTTASTHSQFRMCEVVFTVTQPQAKLVDATNEQASSLVTIKRGDALNVRGRSPDDTWLWVVMQTGEGAAWVQTKEGEVAGALSCVPEVPALNLAME